MKFDPARVVTLADAFVDPRDSGTPGEAAALDRMAVELQGAGWDLERQSVVRRGVSTIRLPALFRHAVPTVEARTPEAPTGLPIVTIVVRAATPPRCRGDNRLGLAFLVELARSWPKSVRNRVDVRFVVQGGPRGASGPVASASHLVIEIADPGLGPTLFIAGTKSQLALDAARDLWVPYAAFRPRMGSIDPRASVVIAGDLRNTTVDEAAIGRAAQLVVEVALRWARSRT